MTPQVKVYFDLHHAICDVGAWGLEAGKVFVINVVPKPKGPVGKQDLNDFVFYSLRCPKYGNNTMLLLDLFHMILLMLGRRSDNCV